MKLTILSICLALSSLSWSQEETIAAPPPEPAAPESSPLQIVDETAEFPGGHAGLYKYLKENFEYPERAVKKNIEGKCYVKFVVDTEGNISEAVIVKKVPNCPECDAEALRVVRKMPRWIPAKVKGKQVKSYYMLPINFVLT